MKKVPNFSSIYLGTILGIALPIVAELIVNAVAK